MEPNLKIVILTGQDSIATCETISLLADLKEVEIAAIITECAPPPFKLRLRNLRRNIRREGIGYLGHRVVEFFGELLESLASRIVSPESVDSLLRESFPEREFSLEAFCRKRGIPVREVGNLNGTQAATAIRELQADLGIVLGTRILKRSTFSIPRMGCINLHKGKVPEYRGMPPGFWELFDGQRTAEVTLHKVDDGLDTGDVLGTATVPIHEKDNPKTLRRKLDLAGGALLAQSVAAWAQGMSDGRRQPSSTLKARTSPTRSQRAHLEKKLGMHANWKASVGYTLKSLLYLTFFYGGVFRLVRAWRRHRGVSHTCILLYHRVNDESEDPLTTSLQRFAEHMLTAQKYYRVIPTASIVTAVKTGQRLPDESIAIHFDDCYRDVYTNASRILGQLEFPSCCFVSSGFVGTDRIFSHDAEKCPFRMANLTAEDLAGLLGRGFEVGAHTVNHADLGQSNHVETTSEVVQSKSDLEKWLGQPVTLFSYPYGERKNISDDAIEVVRHSGCEALFSAYGGYVGANSDLYDLPRWSVSSRFRPIDLLMEIEGLSIAAWKRRWSRTTSQRGASEQRTATSQCAATARESREA